MNSPEAEIRCQALFALGGIGPEAVEAVPMMSTIMLEDSDRSARVQAALALAKMAPTSRTAAPALGQALSDEEPWVRMHAVRALLQLQEEARPAVPALMLALKDETNQTNLNKFAFTIQEAVAVTLGSASTGTAEAVPVMMEALQAATSVRLRMALAQGLGAVGPEAQPAVSQLRAMLKDKSGGIRRTAAEALENIEGKPAIGP